MMNRNTLALLLGIFILIGCKDLEEQFDEQRNLFIGSWSVTEFTTLRKNDTIVSEFDRNYSLTIDNNKAFEKLDSNPNETEYEWYFQLNPREIVFIENFIGVNGNTYTYKVSNLESESMDWTSDYVLRQPDGEDIDVHVDREITINN